MRVPGMLAMLWLGVCLGGVALQGGCAARGLESGPAASGTARLGPLTPARLAVEAAVLSVYANPGESGSGGRMTIERGVTPGARAWTVRRTVGGGPARVQSFVLLDDGSVALTEEINPEEKVEVVFTPALVVLPMGMSVGEQREQELAMVVHPLGDRSRIRARGPVRHIVTYAGDEDLNGMTARRLDSSFVADLSPAKVNNRSTQWFVDGVGLVGEDETETTLVFGLRTRRNVGSWRLADR